MYDNQPGQDSSQNINTPIADDDILDIRALLMVLWRRKWVIVNTTVFCVVLALIIVVQLTPRYTATSLLAIETRKSSVVDLEAVMSGLGTDVAAIKTEIDVLKSRRLLGKMVDKLNLVKDPEFNAALNTKKGFLSYLNPFSYLPDAWVDAILGRQKDTRSDEEIETAIRAKVIDSVSGSLTIINPARSYSIEVAFETIDPKKSAKLANTLSDLYLTDQLEVKFEATQRANEWLNERVFQLREKVRESEQAAQQFREKNQLIQTKNAGLVNEQQLAQLNSQLVDARTELARSEARQQRIEQNARDGKLAESGLLEVLQSPLIQRLKEQESEVQRKRAELGTKYGPKHPRMINVQAEAADIQNKINSEIEKIVASIRAEAEVAAIRVRSLEQNMATLKSESFSVSRSQVQMRELDREAEANRLLLETFLTRFKETSSQDGMQQADTRIISEADVPTLASFPKKKLILLLVLFAGGVVGIGLAFLLEALDNGYRNFDQLRHDLGLRGLGMIPLIGRSVLKNQGPEGYLLAKPTSSFSEAHRNIHASLMFSSASGTIPKLMAITSSVPGEGKSTAGICLAHTLGRSGMKVLLVEADMRRPVMRKRMDIDRQFACLNDVLGRSATSGDLKIFKDAVSNIHVLWADKEDDPQRLFNSKEFELFLKEARLQYDLVIVDTPPVLAVSDVMVISKHVDAMVFAVQWEKTTKGTVKNAVKQLHQTGGYLAGAILTQVDVKRHQGYGYGDQGYYYGTKSGYYTN
ncbi:GumC family protein [Kordiimonas pumila]|uniref:non-specific protein-tyrosine kinase n=1 Tax=Kordiimonas pumila TaxID=2161677 RepID=A0ABV7D5P0_9PROT|nr:polysaccharide biosynthesis tyrosine autokinase [Kordiimonas pumila]